MTDKKTIMSNNMQEEIYRNRSLDVLTMCQKLRQFSTITVYMGQPLVDGTTLPRLEQKSDGGWHISFSDMIDSSELIWSLLYFYAQIMIESNNQDRIYLFRTWCQGKIELNLETVQQTVHAIQQNEILLHKIMKTMVMSLYTVNHLFLYRQCSARISHYTYSLFSRTVPPLVETHKSILHCFNEVGDLMGSFNLTPKLYMLFCRYYPIKHELPLLNGISTIIDGWTSNGPCHGLPRGWMTGKDIERTQSVKRAYQDDLCSPMKRLKLKK
jgi:hypothetical protein